MRFFESPCIETAVSCNSTGGTLRLSPNCAANKRVTAFLGLYRVLKQGWPQEEAFQLMRTVWQPDEVWNTFLSNMLAKRHGQQDNDASVSDQARTVHVGRGL